MKREKGREELKIRDSRFKKKKKQREEGPDLGSSCRRD